jgi:hypothetical protein
MIWNNIYPLAHWQSYLLVKCERVIARLRGTRIGAQYHIIGYTLIFTLDYTGFSFNAFISIRVAFNFGIVLHDAQIMATKLVQLK